MSHRRAVIYHYDGALKAFFAAFMKAIPGGNCPWIFFPPSLPNLLSIQYDRWTPTPLMPPGSSIPWLKSWAHRGRILLQPAFSADGRIKHCCSIGLWSLGMKLVPG